MDVLDKIEISRALTKKNNGDYSALNNIIEKRCPIMYGIKHNYTCNKHNCKNCWRYALMLFAYENYGKEIEF